MATKTLSEIILTTCECLRCKHLWPTRLQGRKPLICPKCRSVYWNTERSLVPTAEMIRVKAVLAQKK